jgi:Pyruvate/2-oxoacid:ferredoxin oxidoreductase delta subunit
LSFIAWNQAMARKIAYWQPSDEHFGLLPEISGNAFNGVGEPVARRARQIFWLRKTAGHAFGRLQDAVVGRYNSVPALYEVFANADRGPKPRSAPAEIREQRPAAEWTRRVKEFALANEADHVGIARSDAAWFYEGYEADLPFVIVFSLAMDYGMLSQQPSTFDNPIAQVEVANQYNRGARVVARTAEWLLERGFRARMHAGPWVHGLSLVPAAIAAGFGELGKHGSLINRMHGSSFRLAAVETDMPLAIDAADTFGADDFCARCKVCTDACPPGAIHNEKGMVRGVEKWWVDFDKCIPYFNETFGCAICLAVCPWSTPGRATTLAEKWSVRARSKAAHDGEEADAHPG